MFHYRLKVINQMFHYWDIFFFTLSSISILLSGSHEFESVCILLLWAQGAKRDVMQTVAISLENLLRHNFFFHCHFYLTYHFFWPYTSSFWLTNHFIVNKNNKKGYFTFRQHSAIVVSTYLLIFFTWSQTYSSILLSLYKQSCMHTSFESPKTEVWLYSMWILWTLPI